MTTYTPLYFRIHKTHIQIWINIPLSIYILSDKHISTLYWKILGVFIYFLIRDYIEQVFGRGGLHPDFLSYTECSSQLPEEKKGEVPVFLIQRTRLIVFGWETTLQSA